MNFNWIWFHTSFHKYLFAVSFGVYILVQLFFVMKIKLINLFIYMNLYFHNNKYVEINITIS